MVFFNILKWGSDSNPETLLAHGDAILTFDSPAPDALVSFPIEYAHEEKALLVQNTLVHRKEVVENSSTLRLLRSGVLCTVLHASNPTKRLPEIPHPLKGMPGLYYDVNTRNRLSHEVGHDDPLEQPEQRQLRLAVIERQLEYLESPPHGLFFQYFDIIIPPKSARKDIKIDPATSIMAPDARLNAMYLLRMATAEITLLPPLALHESMVPNMSDSGTSRVYSTFAMPNSTPIALRPDAISLPAKVFMYRPGDHLFSLLVGLDSTSTLVFLLDEVPTSKIDLNGKRCIIRPSFDIALIENQQK